MLKKLIPNLLQESKLKRSAAKPKSAFTIESLEHRRVLAVGTAAVENGALRVCGTGDANRIVIAELRDSYFVAADFLDSNQTFSKENVSSIKVSGLGGDDTIVATGMSSFLIIEGNAGNDRIFGGSGQELIRGDAGNDLIYGNAGNDTILGGEGQDTIFAGPGNDAINGGGGGDFIHGQDGDDNLRGEGGDDQVFGASGVDTLFGGDGNDLLVGGVGNDTINGGGGGDTLLGSFGSDTLNGDQGPDTIVGGPNDDTLEGGIGDDRMFGDDGTDTMMGGDGRDLMFAGRGPDTMFGGTGGDTMHGGIGNDVVVGDEGPDDLFGGDGQDILIGGTESDELFGGGSQDFLVGSATSNDGDTTSLGVFRDTWTRTEAYDTRVESAESLFTALGDTSSDTMRGNRGLDAFTASSASEVLDNSNGEQLIGLAFLANDDTFIAAIGETINVTAENGVLANDGTLGSDVTVEIITQARHGAITLAQDGSFSYTQTTQGHDFFIYRISNSDGDSDAARVDIEVGGEFPRLSDTATLTALESGVEVFDFSVGSGDMPLASDTVNVDYIGYLPNGEIFDQNDEIDFALSGLIAGFSEGVQGMQPGGRRRIVIPPDQGYGSGGNPGAGIGGTDIITFDVTLNSIVGLGDNEFAISQSAAAGTTVGTVTPSSTLGSERIYEIVNESTPTELALNPDDHFSGSLDAPLVLIDYQSFQCSFCALFHDQLDPVLEQFGDELLVVSRHLTLDPAPFPFAREAALAAEAAAQQGMFAEMVDLLFENQSDWSNATDPQLLFDSYAFSLGLDMDQFAEDRVSDAANASIDDDEDDAAALGATGTPTIYLQGQQLLTTSALTGLSNIIEAQLDLFDDPFVIDRLTGTISVSTAASFSSSSVETFDVRITDIDGNSVTETVTINVT